MNDINIKHKQQGFISIFSVMIIMAILTLVAIGFSNITRSAQRRTLDNQLNTQAFYAAESGVNDAKAVLAGNPAYSKSTCQESPAVAGFNYTIDAGLDTGYTCVLINPATDLKFDSISTEGSAAPKTSVIQSTTGQFGSFDISWTGPNGDPVDIPSPTAANYPNIFDNAATWGTKLGVIHIDFVPLDLGLDRYTLATKTISFYLYPSTASAGGLLGAFSGTKDQAGLVLVGCATNKSPCKATVTITPQSSKYFVRIQSLYNPISQVVINNFKNNAGTPLNPTSGQVVIDSTGRANDVLRRIQVRIPQAGSNSFNSSFAIQSGDSICKRLQVVQPDDLTLTTTDKPGEPACVPDN